MNSRHVTVVAAVISLGALSICQGNNTQPQAPALPPKFVQVQKPQPAPPQQKAQTPSKPQTSSKSQSSSSSSTTGSKSQPTAPQRPQQPTYIIDNNPNNPNNPNSPYYNPNNRTQYSNNTGMNQNQNQNQNPVGNNNPNLNAPAVGNANPAPAPAPAGDTTSSVPSSASMADPEVAQATADLNAAMDKMRDNLMKTNPEYAQAVADKKAAQDENATLRANEASPTPEMLLASATKTLQAGQKVTKIERDAIAKDQAVLDAQAKLKTAVENHTSNASK